MDLSVMVDMKPLLTRFFLLSKKKFSMLRRD